MQSLKTAFVLCLLPFSTIAQTVSTSVSADGGFSYFYEEYRPPKFDLGSFTLCLGGDPDYESGKRKMGENKSNTNSGDLKIETDISSKGFVQHMQAQKVEWESIFNKEEYSFNVKFKKRNGVDRFFNGSSTCNTRNWKFKVESATASINTAVDILVPANTWILRIKTDINKNIGNKVTYNISQVDKIANPKENIKFSDNVALVVGAYEYFFVKPGSTVNLSLDFKSDNQDYDFLANFEVTFVGFNRCEQSMNDFRALLNIPSSAPISSEMVTRALEKVQSNIRTNSPNATEELHKAMAFLGCATSQTASAPLQYDNNVGAMLQILNGIDKFKDSLSISSNQTGTDAINIRGIMAGNVHALNVLANMARYALASTSINNLKPLCLDYEFLSVDMKSNYMTGYLYMRKQLDTIRFLIGIGGPEDALIDRQLEVILNEILKRFEGVDTVEYVANHKPEINQLYKSFLKINSGRMSQAFSRFNDLPKIRATRDLVNLSNAMNDAYISQNSLYYRIVNFFRLLPRIDRTIKDFSLYKNDLADLKEALNRVYTHFPKVYQLVDGDLAYNFRNDVDTMDIDHRAPTETWLNSSYGGFLLDFVKTYKDEKNYLTAKELEKCVSDPEL